MDAGMKRCPTATVPWHGQGMTVAPFLMSACSPGGLEGAGDAARDDVGTFETFRAARAPWRKL